MKTYTLTLTRKKALYGALTASLMVVSCFFGAMATVSTTYQTAYNQGVYDTLANIRTQLAGQDVDFDWTDFGNGNYELHIKILQTGREIILYPQVDLLVKHYRNGVLLSESRGAGVLTTIGKDWIEQQLAASDGTQEALYCSDSNDASAPSAAWTILPNEIVSNGLDRQTGAYVSTGNGAWNVSVTKSVTGTQSTQLWGLNWVVTDNSDNNLLAADSTPDQKNCVSGDTLTETWQITVS